MRRIATIIIMALLFSGLFMFAFNIQSVKAAGTIYIMPNGSISPSTANITTSNSVTYKFTGNNYMPLVVERSNVIINGMGYTLQTNATYAITLSGLTNVTIKNTTVRNGMYGIYMWSSSKCLISGNNVISTNTTAKGDGIPCDDSSNDVLSGNNVTGYGETGIFLYYSNNFTVSGNRLISNGNNHKSVANGNLRLVWSNRNIIRGNQVHGGIQSGMKIYNSSYNTIIGNNVSDGSDILEVWDSPNNRLINNNVTNGMWNGFIIAYDTNVTLIGGRATGVGVTNHIWPNGAYGIDVEDDKNISVINCSSFANGGSGTYWDNTTNGRIINNTFSSNWYCGIEIDNLCSGITITSNTIQNTTKQLNSTGLRFERNSRSNLVYHNNFINNRLQAKDLGSASSGNTWNAAYPTGGNYWSDYLTRYPSATQIDSSGIWNTPYVINGTNMDNYPLMSTYPPSAFSVSISPGSSTLDVGQSRLFTSSITGGKSPYSYQWYLKGVAVPGAIASNFNYTSSASDVGSIAIYVKVTDSSSVPLTAQSNTASVTVNSALVAPTVTATPSTVNRGQTSVLTSSSVTTGTLPYTYQWLQMAPGAVSYSQISSATSSSYSFSTTASTLNGSWSFELKVTDSASPAVTVTSLPVSVVVNSTLVPPTVSIAPTSWTMDVGQSKTFTATPSGGTGSYSSYQWYVGGIAQNGQNASTFSYSPGSAGSPLITVTVTDSSSATSAQSAAPSVTVNSALVAPTLTATPATVNQGQTSSLTSTAVSTGTSPYSYQWYQMAPGAGSYSQISSATSSTYNFATTSSTATGAWSFELKVTDNVGSAVTSSPVSVTVNASSTIIFSDGFESGSFSAWTSHGGTPTVQSTIVHSGTYAMEATATGQYVEKDNFASTSDLFLRFYVYFASVPTSGFTAVAYVYNSAWTGQVFVGILNGRWVIQDQSGVDHVVTSPVPVAGQWYSVEIERKAGSGNGVLNLWINGANVFSSTTETITNNAANLIIGEAYSTTNFNLYLDDVVLANGYI